MTGGFTDSTGIAGDGAALRARLREDGYLFVRGVLDAAAVAVARQETLDALSKCGWLAGGTEPADAVPAQPPRIEGFPEFWEGYVAIQRLESFHRLAHDPALLQLLRAVIDDDVLVHPRKIARISWPDCGHTTPPHQDFRYIQGTADVLTVWTPLGRCPVDLGGLRVLRGSQAAGLRPVMRARGAGGLAVESRDDDPDWVSIDYEPGDVVVFHSLTVHGALPNRTDRLRLSVDFRYQAVTEPITEASLHPHFHPIVPDWAELTGSWPSLATIAAPDGLVRTKFHRPEADLDVPPSALLSPAP